MSSFATGTSRGSNVEKSAVQSRCNRDRQPSAFDANPCAALYARRHRRTMRFESQTSCTLPLVWHPPMHTIRQQPAHKLQQLATDARTDSVATHNTPPRRSNDSRVHSSLNRNTTVRTTRACRRTSRCNLRAHSFTQLPQHLAGTSSSTCTRTASSRLPTMHRNRAHGCHNCSVVL